MAAAGFAALYATHGPTEFVAPHLLAAVLLAIIGAIRTDRPAVLLYIATVIGLLLFGYQLALLGRIDNGISVWFLVPCVAAMILGEHRLVAICGTLTVIEVFGVVIAIRTGLLRGRVVIPEPDVVMAVSIVAVISLCGLFASTALRERRRLAREVEARNAALEAALAATRGARNEALEAARAKERFFANLTHEIRTPLNGIAGTAELLQRTTLSSEQQPLVKALGSSTRSLAELVNAMLDHAKISAGQVKVERAPVNLTGLAQNLRDLFGARAANKRLAFGLTVAEGSPHVIETDGIKLGQIVGNLVSSAIKFTQRGSVEVRLKCADRACPGEGLLLVVEVADTGEGIPPGQIDTVFEPFVQGDTSITRAHCGTGLGLSISRQLAELLGGTLRVVSRVGEGSTFTLALPVAPACESLPAAGGSSRATPVTAGLRVLLAEDNAVNQLVACAMLEALQADVAVAHDGEEAVEMAADGDYQVILLDLQMPLMDGFITKPIRLNQFRDVLTQLTAAAERRCCTRNAL